jgi:hypothetical protein
MLEIIFTYFISKREIKIIEKLWNIKVSEFVHVVDTDGVNHVLKRHGAKSKEEKEKIITEKDLDLIKEIIENADEIVAGGMSSSRKLPTVMYIKYFENYKYYYVAEILKNKKHLRIKTLFKDKI